MNTDHKRLNLKNSGTVELLEKKVKYNNSNNTYIVTAILLLIRVLMSYERSLYF